MGSVGIEFTMKDGGKESFDPVNYPEDFLATVTSYHLETSAGYKYSFSRKDVESFRTYELCPSCGYETGKDGCSNHECSLFIVY